MLAELRRAKCLNADGIGVLPRFRGPGATTLLFCELYDIVRAGSNMPMWCRSAPKTRACETRFAGLKSTFLRPTGCSGGNVEEKRSILFEDFTLTPESPPGCRPRATCALKGTGNPDGWKAARLVGRQYNLAIQSCSWGCLKRASWETESRNHLKNQSPAFLCCVVCICKASEAGIS